MNATAAATIETIIPDWNVQPLWKDNEGSIFSADDVIDAYFKGKMDQKSQEAQLKIEKLKDNLKIALALSEGIFKFIKENGFRTEKIFLKVKDIYTYTAFFVINEDDYCSDDFLKVYEETIRVKKEKNISKTFDFSTILTPSSEYFEVDALLADGYILSYGGI